VGKLAFASLHERRQSAHLPSFDHEPVGGYTTKTVTHGQCDVRPTVTYPAGERNRSLAGNKLYCLVTEAHRCKYSLRKASVYTMVPGLDSNPQPANRKSNVLPIAPPQYYQQQQDVCCEHFNYKNVHITQGAMKPRRVCGVESRVSLLDN